TNGIKSAEPVRLSLTAVPDQTPQVAVVLDGIGTGLTPQARVPVSGQVRDDYGIDKICFQYAVDKSKPDLSPIIIAPGHPIEIELNARNAAFDLRSLKLKPGQKLLIGVQASDLCALGKGANVGEGERWLFDIVSPEELLASLRSREVVLRQRFEVIIKETSETRDILGRLDFSAKDSPDNASLQLLRVQMAITNSRKNAQEVLGLAESFREICKQLQNNRIANEELKRRLQWDLADPLERIGEKMLPELERRLEALLAVLNDAKRSAVAGEFARAQADAVLAAMQRVLQRMIELQDYNEIVDILRDIIKKQEAVREDTEQRRKRIIREFLKGNK
ncbi:MAG: hypothetical protein ACWGMZ_09580, partial [Thermoguttaceae bacterium]